MHIKSPVIQLREARQTVRMRKAKQMAAKLRLRSEGVNLQVANVLVNYDLPWNPMIVEQRIGRIQRLACEHATM